MKKLKSRYICICLNACSAAGSESPVPVVTVDVAAASDLITSAGHRYVDVRYYYLSVCLSVFASSPSYIYRYHVGVYEYQDIYDPSLINFFMHEQREHIYIPPN